MRKVSLEQRFWEKVDKTEACWTWTGAFRGAAKDYGCIRIGGRNEMAHRVAYELCVGAIPPDMFVDHQCHNRGCVRPDHLRLVTRKQNLEHQIGAHANSKSGIRGVRKQKNRWRAEVGHHGKTVYVGLFLTKEEAAEAARLKRLELFTHNDADRVA